MVFSHGWCSDKRKKHTWKQTRRKFEIAPSIKSVTIRTSAWNLQNRNRKPKQKKQTPMAFFNMNNTNIPQNEQMLFLVPKYTRNVFDVLSLIVKLSTPVQLSLCSKTDWGYSKKLQKSAKYTYDTFFPAVVD